MCWSTSVTYRDLPLMSRKFPPTCRELPLMCRELPVTCRSFPLMCRDSPARCRELPVMCRSFPLTCRDFPLRSLKQAYKKEVEFMFLDKSRIALLSSFLFPLLWRRGPGRAVLIQNATLVTKYLTNLSEITL